MVKDERGVCLYQMCVQQWGNPQQRTVGCLWCTYTYVCCLYIFWCVSLSFSLSLKRYPPALMWLWHSEPFEPRQMPSHRQDKFRSVCIQMWSCGIVWHLLYKADIQMFLALPYEYVNRGVFCEMPTKHQGSANCFTFLNQSVLCSSKHMLKYSNVNYFPVITAIHIFRHQW